MTVIYSIYTLVDPRDNAVRYVGMSKEPYRRYAMHLLNPNRSKSAKDEWISELREERKAPQLVIIEENIADKREALEREDYWIRKHREEGALLTNYIAAYQSPVTSKPKRETEDEREPVSADFINMILGKLNTGDSALDRHASNIAVSLGGRIIRRWQETEMEYAAYILSMSRKGNRYIPMGMMLKDFLRLPDDELVKHIKEGIALSEGNALDKSL